MALPFNPMSFVTPYTAVGTGHRGGGTSFANVMNQGRQQKVSEAYLQNAQNQTEFSQKKYGEQEIDKAHQALLDAVSSGDQDKIEAAANNMRVVGSRYGVTIDEVRSDRAEANIAGQTGRAQKALDDAGQPWENVPAKDLGDIDSPGFGRLDAAGQPWENVSSRNLGDIDAPAKSGKIGSTANPLNMDDPASGAAFDQQEATRRADLKARAFTGGIRTPGGSLPMQAGAAATPNEMAPRTPGGSLPQPASAAEPVGTSEAPLRGYTLRGPDGKTLYQVSPQDVISGQRGRVGAVFDNLPADMADAGAVKEAKQIAMGLVGVLTPQQAVMKGLEHLEQGQQRRGALQITEANHKPRFGGGGGGGLMGKGSDIAESLRYYSGPARTAAMKTVNEDQQYADMEQGLNSGDPALQRNAINVLYKIRAGTAVSAAEDARVGGIVSALDKLENKFRQWTGGPISPELLEAMKQIVATKRKINQDFVQRIFDQAADEYEAQNEGKTKDPAVLKRRSGAIRKGSKIIGAESVSEDDF